MLLLVLALMMQGLTEATAAGPMVAWVRENQCTQQQQQHTNKRHSLKVAFNQKSQVQLPQSNVGTCAMTGSAHPSIRCDDGAQPLGTPMVMSCGDLQADVCMIHYAHRQTKHAIIKDCGDAAMIALQRLADVDKSL